MPQDIARHYLYLLWWSAGCEATVHSHPMCLKEKQRQWSSLMPLTDLTDLIDRWPFATQKSSVPHWHLSWSTRAKTTRGYLLTANVWRRERELRKETPSQWPCMLSEHNHWYIVLMALPNKSGMLIQLPDKVSKDSRGGGTDWKRLGHSMATFLMDR